MAYRRILRGILVLAMLTATPPRLVAQPPSAGYVYPPGGKAGTTVDVHFAGADWTPDVKILLHDPRVKLEVVGVPGKILFHEPPYWLGIKSSISDPPNMREVAARLTIPADMPAGPLHWRVANANGASDAGVFVVSHDTEILENENRKHPQEFKIPATISGRLRRIEEVDKYRFRCDKTGPVTVDLFARRLGSNFHGVIEVHDSQGRRIAERVDTEGLDPTVTFVGQKDQWYTLTLRDVDHRGFRCLTYRVCVYAGPQVLAAIPAAGRRGETRDVEFVGMGVASGEAKLESVVRKVTFPNTADASSFDFRLETAWGTSNALALLFCDVPETLATAVMMPLTVPQAVTGRLLKRDGQARFRFDGKKGEAYRIEAQARRIGSPLDTALVLLGPDGKEVAANDDMPGTTDSLLGVKLPVDGTYQIVLSDVAGTPPSPATIYRLVLERQPDDFRLETLPSLSVPIGDKANLNVTVVREGEMKEPIAIQISGLPAGVTVADKLVIAPTATSLAIPFTCDKTAAAGPAFIKIVGTAKLAGKEVTRTATVPLAGDLTGRHLAANRHSAVLLATTIKPPFAIKLVEADGGRRVHRGATHLTEVLIDRKVGFKGEIILDMAGMQSRHSQGIRGSAFTVPPGADKVHYPVFLPEGVETTNTRRLSLVARAQLVDGAGKLHFVLAPMKGQITMSVEGALLKLSQQTEELVVSAGQSFNVPLKLARSTKLTTPARVELIVPEELAGLVHAEPLEMSAKQEAADWKITTKADPRLQGRFTVLARATAQREGHPVVSESAFEIEFASPASVPMKTR